MTVVSDTSPLRYLIAAGRMNLVKHVFGRVLIPRGVEQELTDPSTPNAVRQWMAQRPPWLQVRGVPQPPDPHLAQRLDRGEAQAIQLAIDLRADFLLIDERRGRRMAAAMGVIVIGVLGILLESYRQSLIQNPFEIVAQLRSTGFRISLRLLREFEEQIHCLGG